MTPEEGRALGELIRRGRVADARAIMRARLRRRFEDETDRHYYLTRLAATYVDQKAYVRAMPYVEKSLELAPWCTPTAETYADLRVSTGGQREAIAMYKRFVKRGAEAIADMPCGQGIRQARQVVADALYSIAWAYQSLGKPKAGVPFMERHLALRAEGYPSRITVREGRRLLEELRG